MLKIIIPLAGPSEMFQQAGYIYPKPLIEINGVPMIQLVIEQARDIDEPCQFVFIIKEEDSIKFHLDNTLRLLSASCEIVKLKRPTSGSLCSVLMAIDNINDDDSLIILNGDQLLDIEYHDVLNFWRSKNADAGLITFKSVHPRWSYARLENERVVQTAEKNPISNNAMVGYYFFAHAATFFKAAFRVIQNDVNFDGSYFTSPVINEYVLLNKNILQYQIDAQAHHSFYSPQMIEEYAKNLTRNEFRTV